MEAKDSATAAGGALAEMSNRERAEEMDELDSFIENVTRIIEAEDEKIYSKEVIEEFKNPTHAYRMTDADAEGIADGLCGDTMEMYIKVDGERIKACSFYTDGCGATIACGNRLARHVEGMDIEAARNVSPEELISLLNGLPEEHKHCASLSVLALRNAIRKLEERRFCKPESASRIAKNGKS
jgi:nitrogen fixation NifU-like protein